MQLATGCLLLSLFAASPALAQGVLIPDDRTTEIETGCEIRGLDPNGDGFLALRTGPGTQYPQIGVLHNGDAAYVAAASRGRWLYVENGALNGREAQFHGWINDASCLFYP